MVAESLVDPRPRRGAPLAHPHALWV